MKKTLYILAFSINALAWAVPSQVPLENGWIADDPVHAVAVSNGTTYVGGTFTMVGVNSAHGVALHPTTAALPASFAKINESIYAVVQDGAGGWFVAGEFFFVDGVPRHQLAHILANGSLDMSWDPGSGAARSPIFGAGSASPIGWTAMAR